jgi:hypothetical protein
MERTPQPSRPRASHVYPSQQSSLRGKPGPARIADAPMLALSVGSRRIGPMCGPQRLTIPKLFPFR